MEEPVIQAERVCLRPMRPGEAERFRAWAAETPWWYGTGRAPAREAFLAEWGAHAFEGPATERGRVFVIEHGGEAAGAVAYNEVHPVHRACEIEIVLDEAHTGRGYGPDALRALSDWLFAELDVNRVYAFPHAGNARAHRAYEKAGFTREGVLRGAELFDGRFVDDVLYARLRSDGRSP
jgi:RimJ/RimL family protein N-acetyltransferase